MKTQLLCTFTTKRKAAATVMQIQKQHNIVYDKIFILTTDNRQSPGEVVCSYNIVPDPNVQFLPGTILVHRKKDSNTLYTINALNQLIMTINNGILDTSYQIDWQNYKNSILLVGTINVKKINTKIYDIINV